MNIQKRRELFRQADQKTQELYGSLELAELLSSLITEYSIKEEEVFILTVGDLILRLYPLSQTTSLLHERLQLPEAQTAMLSGRIRDFLKPRLQKVSEEPASGKEHDQTIQPDLVVKPFDETTINAQKPHGYGAGLPVEELTYSSKQEDVVSKPTNSNPHTDQNLPPWQK